MVKPPHHVLIVDANDSSPQPVVPLLPIHHFSPCSNAFYSIYVAIYVVRPPMYECDYVNVGFLVHLKRRVVQWPAKVVEHCTVLVLVQDSD